MESLEQILRKNSDKKQADFTRKLTFTKYNIWGIKIPQLRKISKSYANEMGLKELFQIPIICFEHQLLRGMAIANSKLSLEDKLEYFTKYIDDCDDWMGTDVVSLKPKADKESQYFEQLLKWAKSGECWRERFAFTEMLSIYSKKEDFLERIINEIKGNNSEEYYVKMAKAWLISMLYINFPNTIHKLLEEKCLDKFTQNKSICKIRDSLKATSEQKEAVKALRIS